MGKYDLWQNAKKGDVHKKVIDYVSEVERNQSDLFDRFAKLAWLYDSYSRSYDGDRRGRDALVTENVIASNVDTVAAAISVTKVRPRVMTDGADWSAQRRAKQLEQYSGELNRKFRVHQQARRGFKEGSLKGTGLVKVHTNIHKQIKVERALVDDIIVDNVAARLSEPQQMHHRLFVGRDVLTAQFPKFERQINASYDSSYGHDSRRMWADYRPIEQSEVVAIESWYLPLGVEGKPGYRPGRHAITINGADLHDEEWHKTHFPFAVFKWSERPTGWYGIGGGERIAGHQRELNRNNWQIDRQIQQLAVPTTFVRPQDAKLAIQSVNRVGTTVVVKGEYPKTIIPPAVSGEQYARREAIIASAFAEFGNSRMAATSQKPVGLDSGAALREHKDQVSGRHSTQEQDFEEYVLRVTWLILDNCKDLGADAPEVIRRSRYGPKKIRWADVDMGELEIQLEAASELAKTPAGRTALAMEMAQAGLISKDMAMRDMEHPDMVQTMSVYTAAIENIERIVEEVMDSKEVIVPEPSHPLKIGIWRFTAAINQAEINGAPEDVIERLRHWSNSAAWMLDEQERKAQEQAMMAQAGMMPGPGASEQLGLPPEAMGPAEASPDIGAALAEAPPELAAAV